jgi:hypothetical protein
MTKARDLANGGFGLVLVKPSTVVNGTDNGKGTVSFSAASSVSLNDVFSATYKNYVVQINLDSVSISNYQRMRLRVSGADNTTSNYYWSGLYNASSATTVVGEGGAAQSSFGYGYMESPTAGGAIYSLTLSNPFASFNTAYHGNSSRWTSTANLNYVNSGAFSATTSFTGFTIFPDSGTITGTVSVYGINK